MTKNQAMTVVSDLVNAGYNAQAVQQSAGSWKVEAWTADGAVSVSVVASFASSHSVTATTDRTEFV